VNFGSLPPFIGTFGYPSGEGRRKLQGLSGYLRFPLLLLFSSKDMTFYLQYTFMGFTGTLVRSSLSEWSNVMGLRTVGKFRIFRRVSCVGRIASTVRVVHRLLFPQTWGIRMYQIDSGYEMYGSGISGASNAPRQHQAE